MPQLWLNDNNTVRNTTALWVNDGGTVREVANLWANEGGTVRLVYTSGVPSFVDSEVVTSGTSWTPSTTESYSNIHVWVIGGGGSGGASSTNSGREKISNGGGAGGTAYRVFTRAQAQAGATLSIGAGGAGTTTSGGGNNISGRSGSNTTFTLGGVTMTGGGGGSGGAGRNTNGEASTTNTSGAWGAVSATSGGTASGGTENYTGGGNIAYSIGGDGSQASSGGSTNLSGQAAASLNGVVVGGSGFAQGAAGPRPNFPRLPVQFLRTHFPMENFNGGAAQQHSSGGPVTGAVGNPYGAGGGSASAESSTATSGAGGQGAVIILYEGRAEEIPPTMITNGFTEAQSVNPSSPSVFRPFAEDFNIVQLLVPNNGPDVGTLVTAWSREASNGDAIFFADAWPDDGSAYATWVVGVRLNFNNGADDNLVVQLFDVPTFNGGTGGAFDTVEPSTTVDEQLWDTADIVIRGTTSETEASITLNRTALTFESFRGNHSDLENFLSIPPRHERSFTPTNARTSFTPAFTTASGFQENEPLQVSITLSEAT